MLDVWAHRHVDNPKLRDEIVNDQFEDDVREWETELGILHEDLPPPVAPGADPTDDAEPDAAVEPDPDDFEPVVSDTYGSRT